MENKTSIILKFPKDDLLVKFFREDDTSFCIAFGEESKPDAQRAIYISKSDLERLVRFLCLEVAQMKK
jgi:hypothetical protein